MTLQEAPQMGSKYPQQWKEISEQHWRGGDHDILNMMFSSKFPFSAQQFPRILTTKWGLIFFRTETSRQVKWKHMLSSSNLVETDNDFALPSCSDPTSSVQFQSKTPES